MKTEQQKIAKELAAIDHEIDLHNITFEQISANLDMVLDIVENCGEAYRNASDTIKKLMNQAIFEKFYISNGPEDEFGVKLTFKAPYDQILDPIKEDLSQINTALKRKPEAVDGLADKAKGHIHDFFGCGPNLGQNKNPYSNESDFFNPNSSSKDLMVEVWGVEPQSENRTTGLSPCAFYVLTFPLPRRRRRRCGFSSFIKSRPPQSLSGLVPCFYDADGLRRRRLRVDDRGLSRESYVFVVVSSF